MRKLLIALAALLYAAVTLEAVPAYPYPIRHRQPDGSWITIQIHGDEFYHYTTSGGRVVALDKDGFYRPSVKPFRRVTDFELRSKSMRKAALRSASAAAENPMTHGRKKFLVILVSFKDKDFSSSTPQADFSALLNKQGYSRHGATGSVYDYYHENSSGVFEPEFVVAGPYAADNGYATYGVNDSDGDDTNPSQAFYEACIKAAADGLDFSQFDNDGDGWVDNVYFFYAGYGEADGGGADTIWPHASSMDGNSLNGVRIGRYACSAENRVSTGSMSGIGTFCHEFGHVLGLLDFYDVDYSENGTANEVYNFSLMSQGSYNNNGCTPPYLSVMERTMLGWMDMPADANDGDRVIAPVYKNDGMRSPSSVEEEFFIYEVRDGSGWDRYIPDGPTGMLVYHCDRSLNSVGETAYAASLWRMNSINNYASHPCYYLVMQYSGSGMRSYMLPGPGNVTSFTAIDWGGQNTGYNITNIRNVENGVGFNVGINRNKTVSGLVTSSSGKPLKGVSVSLAAASQAPSGRRLVSLRELRNASSASATTDANGRYSVTIEDCVSSELSIVFTKDRYQSYGESFSMPTASVTKNAMLYNVTEGFSGTLQKCKSPFSSIGFSSQASTYSATCGVHYSEAELADYAGDKLNSISFHITGSPAQVDVFVDFGNTRVFTKKADNYRSGYICKVDISDEGIRIPSGSDMIIGYAVKDNPTQYFMSIDGEVPVEGGGYVLGEYSTEGSMSWQAVPYNLIISADTEENVSAFNGMGIKVISNPAREFGYEEGCEFPLAIVNPEAGQVAVQTVWYYDGQEAATPSIVLSGKGRHTLKAVLTYSDGSTEEIEQVILVR